MKWLVLQHLLVAGEVNLGNRPKRKPIVPSGVFGMVVFIITEVMFFSGLVSAYLIIRAGLDEWPPWGQPRLPIESTAFNTLLLIISAFAVYQSRKLLKNNLITRASQFHLGAILLGLCFLLLQGYEWVQLLQFGMTLSSSVYGALFYLIIGAHGLHVFCALVLMTYGFVHFKREKSYETISSNLLPMQILWYFVVGIWPLLYTLVYLI